jgi:alpha-tubulin suppressor-like RCC1 family protein
MVPLEIGSDTDWTAISAGGLHSCGLRGTSASCWGYDLYGELGDGGNTQQASPVAIAGTWDAIHAGVYHTCAIGGGALACWGLAAQGQVGVPGAIFATPQAIAPATGWLDVAPGYLHTCARRVDGVWCWGSNAQGQLGVDPTDTPASSLPNEVNPCIL